MSAARSRRTVEPLAFIPPCLASAASSPPSGDDWVHEIKYDGYRVQAHIEHGRVTLFTRNGNDWTQRFGRVADDIRALPVRRAIIDGEAIVQDASGVANFGALTSELKTGSSECILMMAFDLLYLDDADLRGQPLLERKSVLNRVLDRAGATSLVCFSQHMLADGRDVLRGACDIGVEGIVSKRADKAYRSGRNGDWIKAKCHMADPFVIIGYVPSKAAGEAVGSLVVGFYAGSTLVYAGRVGTGFSARVAAELWRMMQPMLSPTIPVIADSLDRTQRSGVVWVKPKLVARVEYRAWTEDNILRHATFKDLRHDKQPREIGKPASQKPVT